MHQDRAHEKRVNNFRRKLQPGCKIFGSERAFLWHVNVILSFFLRDSVDDTSIIEELSLQRDILRSEIKEDFTGLNKS